MPALMEQAHRVTLPGLRVEHGLDLPFAIPDAIATAVIAGTPAKGSFRAQRAIDAAVEKLTSGRVTDLPALMHQSLKQLRGQAHLEFYASGGWDDPGSIQIACEMIPSGVTSLPGVKLRPTLEARDPGTVTVPFQDSRTGAAGILRERRFVVRWVAEIGISTPSACYEYYLRRDEIVVQTAGHRAT